VTLTADQRWLLMTIGGWQIIDALAAPAGVVLQGLRQALPVPRHHVRVPAVCECGDQAHQRRNERGMSDNTGIEWTDAIPEGATA